MPGIDIVSLGAALGAGLRGYAGTEGVGHFHGHDAGRYGDDGVAENHHQRCHGLAESGLGRNIAIADGGQGDDGPVDAPWDAGETVGLTLDDVHQGTENDHQGRNRVEKNSDLAAAGP